MMLPAFAWYMCLRQRLGRQKGAVEMDRQQPLPVGEREIDDRLDDLNAGIADQHIDPAVFRHRVGDAFLDRRLVGHVHARPQRHPGRFALISRAVASAASRLRSAITGAAALGGKAQRDLLADAAGGTGDDRDLSSRNGTFQGSFHASCQVIEHDLARDRGSGR